MKHSAEAILQTKSLISYGFRPQQIKSLTGLNESKVTMLTKEMVEDGVFIRSKGLLSPNKILRTKFYFRQFSLWMLIYKSLITAEFNFRRLTLPVPWHKSLDTNILIKSQIMLTNILASEFELDEAKVISAAECYSILYEISCKESTYLRGCSACGIDYVVVESSKHTDKCPFCQERKFESERNRLDLEIFA